MMKIWLKNTDNILKAVQSYVIHREDMNETNF